MANNNFITPDIVAKEALLVLQSNLVMADLVHRDYSSDVVLDSIAGTYEGTLPAADCPGIKTVLTLNADSTYQYSADYLERKDGHDEASGIFKVLANNVVEITRPSSGETTYFKVKDANSLIMTDSLGTEPEGAMAKHYVLTKKK